jgi:hypothetical protein
MTISKPAARKLATQAEWTLLEMSYAPALKEITLGRLKQKVTRARKLQDKYRDLARQQRGEARGKRRVKGTRPAAGNVNTVNKQMMFAEALERFQGQLVKLEAKVAKEAARKAKALGKRRPAAARKTTKTATRTAAKKAAGAKAPKVKAKRTALLAGSKATRGVRKSAKLSRKGVAAQRGHIGARGKRQQARRDGR